MLRRLQRHPLLVGVAEVLADVARHVAVVVILMILVGLLVKLLDAGT